MKTKKQLFEKLPKLKHDSKVMLLTHTDLDGEMPVILLKSAFADVSVIHCPNNVMDDKIRTTLLEYADNYDFIVACDISCNEATAGLIDNCDAKNKFVLLDHHATAEHLNKYSWACVYSDMVEDSFRTKFYESDMLSSAHSSGTALLYDYMDFNGFTKNIPNPNLMQQFVQKTSGYDTWDWHDLLNDDQSYKQLNDMYYLYGNELFEANLLDKLINNDSEIFNKHDEMFLEIDKKRTAETVERISKSFKEGKIAIDDKTYTMAICFTDLYPSDVFASMKENMPDKDIYIINNSTGLSLRTDKDDIDVSVIAKHFGGGGHPKASGFSISIDDKIHFLENTLNVKIKIDEPTPKPTALKRPVIKHKSTGVDINNPTENIVDKTIALTL